MELETRRFMLVAPGAAVRPGDELTIHFEPGPDVVVLPTHWGGLHAQFTPTGGKPAPWTLRGGPRKVLHPQVPQTAAPGPGELIIAGVMPAAVTTCDGVAGCNASVVVNTVIPLDIVP